MKAKLFIFVVAIFMATTTFAQFSGSGSGTSSDPYLIFNPIQLDQVRNFLNQGGVYFKLMANIDLAEFIADNYPTQGWLPIGTEASPFKGNFNGNGKTISNLTINRPSTNYVGLFGYIISNSVPISNLTVEGTIVGGDYTGGVIGELHGDINKVSARVHVEGNRYVGGLAGACYATQEKTGVVQNSFVEAYVAGTEEVGGLVGRIGSVVLKKSTAIISIKFNGNYGGGIVGKAGIYGYVRQCCAFGRIEANSYVGGIVGYSEGHLDSGRTNNDIEDSYFHGTLVGKSCVGGVCGLGKNVDILRNYSCATILGISAYGIASGGDNYTNIKQNVAINSKVYGTTSASRVGSGNGEIGTNETNKALTTTKVIINGAEQVCEDNLQNGQGVGNSVLKYQAAYQGIEWDFTDTWAIQETETYPYLKRQVAPPTINSAASGQTTVSGKGTNGKVIKVSIDGKTYQTTCSNNTWSVTTDALVGGSIIYAYAGTGTATSYPATTTVAYQGSGTESDPYKIYTAKELANIHGDGYFKLMNDIDVSSINPWIPIGQNEIATACLYGDNHTISGLKINTTASYQGLFAQCNGSVFKDVTISVSQLKGGDYTGALVGKIVDGHIYRCKVSGNVTGGQYTGGLVGYSQNILYKNCISNSTVVGTTNVGGLIGFAKFNAIQQSKSTGSVSSSTANAIVGGLIGSNEANVQECCASGNVSCNKSSSIVGGLIGQNNGRPIKNSYSTGAVTGTKYAGGLIGYNKGTTQSGSYTATVENCYARGKVTGTSAAAGLVGYNDGQYAIVKSSCVMNPTITASSSTGIVMRVVGGLLNSAPAPDMNNYALKTMALSVNGVAQTIYDDNLNGTAKTDNVLKQASTYSGLGWNMTSVWGIIEGSGYPYLMCFEGSQYFTVTFVDWDGKELKKESVQYGKTATPPSDPQRTGYVFTGWTPSIAQITKNTTYTATYKEIPRIDDFAFFSLQNGSAIGLISLASHQTLEYSTNGTTWYNMTTESTITINNGELLHVRGILTDNNSSTDYTRFSISGSIAAIGNINYLWNYQNPNTSLKNYCGHRLFLDCKGLTMASQLELPTQTLSEGCYSYMFAGCLNLISIPKLPAKSLANSCYCRMFNHCESLVTAFDDLPAITLSEYCYDNMFSYCYSLTEAPLLPATILEDYCYNGMFYRCTSLTTAPELPAPTLVQYCYRNMFGECGKLNYIKCLATNISATECTTNWVNLVAKSGTFVKNSAMSAWTIGANGIPTDWTTQNYTIPKYTITFLDEDGSTLLSQQWNYGTTPTCDEPTKPATAQYTYTFAGWTPEVVAVTGDATYTATYTSTLRKYTITFLDEDGSVLSSQQWNYGVTPTCDEPFKPATAQYNYIFAGWDSEVVKVTGNATYTATYTATLRKYTVTFLDEDGTVLYSQQWNYGTTPTCDEPTKPATAQYTYTFAGWNPEVTKVTGNATYTATYTSTLRKYTVTFLDEDGTLLSSQLWNHGAMPTCEEPTKPATAQYTYTFAGWDPDITKVTGAATYTAIYSSVLNKYSITFIVGPINYPVTVKYGTLMGTLMAGLWAEAQDQYGFTQNADGNYQYSDGANIYTFIGWDKEIPEKVVGEATYTATYTVAPVLPTALENQQSQITNQKLLKDGHLFILRDGKIYNAQGARVE